MAESNPPDDCRDGCNVQVSLRHFRAARISAPMMRPPQITSRLFVLMTADYSAAVIFTQSTRSRETRQGPPQNLGQPVASLLPERTDTDGIALSRRNLSSGKSLIDAGYRPERASKWFSVHHTITPRRHRSREMKTPGMCHAKVWIEN
jgi:hypothetical protein